MAQWLQSAAVGAGTGAVVAAIGASIQGVLQRRQEDRVDLRRARRDCYTALLAVAARLAEETNACHRTRSRTHEHSDNVAELYDAYHRSRLVCERRSTEALKRFFKAARDLATACEQADAQFDAARDRFQDARRAARAQMRDELGVTD